MAVVEISDIPNCKILRVTCGCHDMNHNLEFFIDQEEPGMHEIYVNTAEHTAFHLNYWVERLKAIWCIFIGKPICLGGITTRSEDLKAIAKFIQDNVK